MNQSKTHILRRLFLKIQPFPSGDPRNKSAWREFKERYNAQSRPSRASYLVDLKREIAELLAKTAAVETTQTT